MYTPDRPLPTTTVLSVNPFPTMKKSDYSAISVYFYIYYIELEHRGGTLER